MNTRRPKSGGNRPPRASRPGAKKRNTKRKPEPNNTPIIIGGIVFGVLVVVGVIGFVLSSGGKDKNDPTGVGQQSPNNDGEGDSGNQSETASTVAPEPFPKSSFGWPLAADAQSFEWPDSVEPPVKETGWSTLFSTASSGYAVTGFEGSHAQNTESWSLFDGKKIGKIEEKTSDASLKALGPAGELLAMRPNGKENQHRVEIWSYKTGQKVATIECEQPDRKVDTMTLAGNNRLLSCSSTFVDAKYQHVLRLFDIDSKKEIASEVLDDRFNLGTAGMSPNGRYIVRLSSQGELLVYETQDLKRVAFTKFDAPKFGMMGGVAFNSTGDKIASLWSVSERSEIYVTDVQNGATSKVAQFSGSLLYSPVTGEIYMGRGLQWLAEDSGWLVYGRGVVDAASGQLVWLFDSTLAGASAPRIAVPNGVFAQIGESSIRKKLIQLEIPWETIRESLSAAASDSEARLKEGGELAIDVQVGALRFADANQTKTQLTEVVEKRLKADGFTVVNRADVTLKVKYSEAVGKKVAKLGDILGKNSFDSTTAKFNLEWIANGIGTPILVMEIPVSPRLLRVKDSNPQGYRAAIFEKAKGQLANFPSLYFVGTGDAPATLPGVTIFE